MNYNQCTMSLTISSRKNEYNNNIKKQAAEINSTKDHLKQTRLKLIFTMIRTLSKDQYRSEKPSTKCMDRKCH